MNTSTLISALVALTLLPLPAPAAPTAPARLPVDVPALHWAAGSVQRVLHEKILGRDPDGRFRGDQAVTRYELAVTLDRFVRYIEAARKPLHVNAPTHLPPVAIAVPSPVQDAIRHLVSNGFLAANSPLLTRSGNGNATAAELSDALASVTIRLSDRAEPPQK